MEGHAELDVIMHVQVFTLNCWLQNVPQWFPQELLSPPRCLWWAVGGAAPGQRWGRNPDCWSRSPLESGHTPPPPREMREILQLQGRRVTGRKQEKHSITHPNCLWPHTLLLSVFYNLTLFTFHLHTILFCLVQVVPFFPSSVCRHQRPTQSKQFKPQLGDYI